MHEATNVSLSSSKDLLPDWGFKQQEVNGNKHNAEKQNMWMAATVSRELELPSELLEDEAKQNDTLISSMGWFAKFLELQVVMLVQNAGLTGSHPYQSQPLSWAVYWRGISFWMDKQKSQIYLVANPAAWWVAFFSVFAFGSIALVDQIASRRGFIILDHGLCRFMTLTL